MARGIFVTGTDTGVGKTIVAGLLVRAARILGFTVAGMKPVETGCRRSGDALLCSDGSYLRDMANMDELVHHLTPCAYEVPLSPMAAAEIEERAIDVPLIVDRFQSLARKYDAVIVEGTGGILVPLNEKYFIADLAIDMGLSLVVVASPFLGTINHTLLTVEYAQRRGLDVAGFIINYSTPPERTLAEKTNPQLLDRLCPVPMIGVVPYLEDMSTEGLDRIVSRHLDMDVIGRALRSGQ